MPVLLNTSAPNLFDGLFSQRPRDLRRPDEDFLTEAFAYVLATEEQLQAPVVSALTKGRVQGARLTEIETQLPVAREDLSRCRPDLCLRGADADDRPFEIWLENKWGAGLGRNQLETYRAELGRLKPSVTRHLVFVSPRHAEVMVAAAFLKGRPKGVTGSAITWPELHGLLGAEDEREGVLAQFRRFMSANGLGAVRPATLEAAHAYRAARDAGQRLGSANTYRRTLKGLCGAALEVHLSDRLESKLILWDGWGRVGLFTPDDKASVGLLYDPGDHRTDFLAADRPTDIVVRIQANPDGQSQAQLETSRARLAPIADALESLDFNCNPNGGRWRNNRHNLLLAHYRPGFPWSLPSGPEQAARLAAIFEPAFEVLLSPVARKRIAALPPY